MRNLGLTVNSETRQFLIPDDKKVKFIDLRENILMQDWVSVLTLQKFMGKCVSFKLCFPAAVLYIRAMAREISRAGKQQADIPVRGDLQEEVEFWRFIDNCSEGATWRGERHVDINMATDASGFGWGATLPNGEVINDLWAVDDNRPIHLKEGVALLKTLQSITPSIQDKRVDVLVDNQAVVKSWQNQGSRDPELTKLIKSIFQCVLSLNCDLKLIYVPSEDNPADSPSRRLSLGDSRLSKFAWTSVEEQYGPHSFDLMALDSNVMKDSKGAPLQHYSPWPLPGSNGVNVFSQVLNKEENYYCFPPFCLVGSVLAFIIHENPRPLKVTMVVSRLSPLPPWWPILLSIATITPLGKTGDGGILEAPSKNGYVPLKLLHPLVVARFCLM
jgi:hypothetical protein